MDQVNDWLCGFSHDQGFGFYDFRWALERLGMQASDETQLSSWNKSVQGNKVAGVITRKISRFSGRRGCSSTLQRKARELCQFRKQQGKPLNCPKESCEGFSEKVMLLIAQLKCLYTNECSLRNQQNLETTVQLENYELIAIIETWQNDSHDWRMMIEVQKVFRRYRQGKKDGRVAFCIEVGRMTAEKQQSG